MPRDTKYWKKFSTHQVRKPAEAEKYRLEKIAEAERNRVVLEAEAEAEAQALRGEAEAYAIEVKAKAEAEQMAKKADAWKEYQEAALVDMMLKVCSSFILMKISFCFTFVFNTLQNPIQTICL